MSILGGHIRFTLFICYLMNVRIRNFGFFRNDYFAQNGGFSRLPLVDQCMAALKHTCFECSFKSLAQHTDGVHRHPPYVVHDIIGYFSSVFQPFWGHNALRYRRLLCLGRRQLPGIIVYYVAWLASVSIISSPLKGRYRRHAGNHQSMKAGR